MSEAYGSKYCKGQRKSTKEIFSFCPTLLALRVHDCFSFARKEMPNGILHNSLP
jgi:hypothetical protein